MRWLRALLFLFGLWLTPVAHAETAAPSAGVVNITSASAEELERLPGIGEKKASAIVEHRRTHPLRRLEDLTKVKGIGRKTVARLRPYLTLTGPTTLKDRPARGK
jgi:competence protein ComEA